MINRILPAEWYPQSFVQLTWPHINSDWHDDIKEVTECFVRLATEIIKHEKVLIVCPNAEDVKNQLNFDTYENVYFVEMQTNDTWARDHGMITTFEGSEIIVNDFVFNGWGMKFAANYDNKISNQLYKEGVFSNAEYVNRFPFVLEGGSIESDGMGTILTTENCLLSKNRNEYLSKSEIEDRMYDYFGVSRVLWLKHGYLAGDDTDSHIDTLARFCNVNTIAYVSCNDKNDEHYDELKAMEKELQEFRNEKGEPYQLVALPMAEPVFNGDERLPATYANFLICNNAVLVPTYDCPQDEEALNVIKTCFPDREVVGVDCQVLIKQHGSLHCVTMQYPCGVV